MRPMPHRRLLIALPLLFAGPAYAAPEPAQVAALVAKVDIPYEAFTLPNGLRVLVHTDRKAPVVALSVWYHVGSKDEPAGKTGFAHLFEHLMFNGSENAPEDFFTPLQQIGGTDYNGTTWFDRTNYFETVPTGALQTALFLESDRMGHLLGGIDQTKLDNQRGVVQNEKRQGDNEPFGLTEYTVQATLFPVGHPYHHTTIGSMADLNGASLTDVKNWFRARYGPDNAVLVLAGDIDAKTAKPLVTKWFGDIPRGPAITRVEAPVPTLAAPVTKVLKDRVPYTRVERRWAVEGVNGADTTALEVAASVLGGLSSSRLDNALVRGDQSAISVSASVEAFEQVGIFTISANVKPGADPVAVGKKIDAIVADFLKNGPTADEVRRVATRSISATIGGYESVGGFGGKAVALAEGLVYSDDPQKYKKDLAELAAQTPATVMAASRKWLSRPVFNLTIEPGPRDTSPAAMALAGDDATGAAPAPAVTTASVPPKPTRTAPPVGAFPPLKFPAIERTTLANGISVYFARRPAVPVVRVSVSFDAGSSADPADTLGLQSLTMALLDEGTKTKTSVQLAEAQERLGATISSGGGIDRSNVGLYALTPNLGASLDLLADIVRNPAFDPKEVERLRGQQLAAISAQLSQPNGVASYVLPGKLYGAAYPYGRPFSGLGDAASVAKISRDAIAGFHHDWLYAGNAAIFVVGDTDMATLKPLLESSFGNWPTDRMARPRKSFAAPIPANAATKIYLVDRPGSPQSVIAGGQVLANEGKDDALIVLRQANDVLGGSFLSRLNTDLRETKGWSYGVSASIPTLENRVPYMINAPVQADRTGDSVAALIADIKTFLGPKGTTPEELERTVNGSIRELPGNFETSDAVLGAMQRIIYLGRPDNFYETLADRYRAMTAADFDKAARAAIDPNKLVFVVVGDAAKVKPQLEKLGLPLETVQLPVAK
ncbi:insulinase family protein [Sphingomonas paeninsulae]|uniref:Insulinase family protein n=2 Tax=Sphingomonas paeninsulae TaxID=2319844 RepID=A0A494TMT0_SPHPE|nr:insulinase family protein [Sphingomonas paeninsulae]